MDTEPGLRSRGFRLRRRGVETKLVLGNPTKSVDRTLLRNIRNALSWLDRIKAGKTYEEIATEAPLCQHP